LKAHDYNPSLFSPYGNVSQFYLIAHGVSHQRAVVIHSGGVYKNTRGYFLLAFPFLFFLGFFKHNSLQSKSCQLQTMDGPQRV
jgi:hypothetical protein